MVSLLVINHSNPGAKFRLARTPLNAAPDLANEHDEYTIENRRAVRY